MAGTRPTILVVGDDGDERTAIAAVLRDAGFAVVAQDRGARAGLTCKRLAAAVIALPENAGVEFHRRLRHRQPGLPVLIVIEPAATRFIDADDDTLVTRPFDPRQLLGRVFELVLRRDGGARPQHLHAAELGIAAARLACLDRGRAAAAAAGRQAAD